MAVNIRNAKYNRDGNIDLEYNHPQYGWIPYTAIEQGDTELSSELFAAAVAGNVSPYTPPAATQKTVWEPRQFLKRFPLSVRAAVVTSNDPEVLIVYHETLAAQFVDINDPDTAEGLTLLVSKGLLTEQEKTDLLTPETIG